VRNAVRLLAFALALGPASAGATDLDHGKTVFNRCRVCHQVGESAKNSVGPILNGVVGRPAASVADYNYSVAMKNSKLVWDDATLDQYLTSPRTIVQGTKMTFAGLSQAEDRADLIAWLKQNGASAPQ
jgi:cytochrome c